MQVLDVMRYGQDMVMETARRYRPEDWSRVALGVWTAKDLLGHLSAFEVRMADVLATFVDEAPASDLMSADTETFNDDQAAIRADWPIEQVLEEFTSAHARLMAHAERIPAERWRELGNRACFIQSPEICVEIISPSNSEEEIREKMALYFDAGAQEVWICGIFGKMSFFGPGSAPLRRSELCLEFPEEV